MSFLLSKKRSIFDTVTIWEPMGHGPTGEPLFSLPRQVKGLWEDKKVIVTSQSSKDVEIRSFLYSFEELPVGSHVYDGVSYRQFPEVDTKEIESFFVMDMISQRRTVYEYAL